MRGTKGFTYIEIIVASGVLLIGLFATAAFFANFKYQIKTVDFKQNCIAHLNSVFSRLEDQREKGVIITPAVVANNSDFSSLSQSTQIQNQSFLAVKTADRWFLNSNSPAVSSPGQIKSSSNTLISSANPGNPSEIRTSILINSYMTTLSAIYNSNPTQYCSLPNGAVYESGTTPNLFTPNVGINLPNLKTLIKVEPIKLDTGASLNCPLARVLPRPSGLFHRDPGSTVFDGATKLFKVASDTDEDLAYDVTLTAQYTDSKNQNQQCSQKKRYNYQRDENPPAPPVDLTLAPPACVAAGSNVTLSLGYNGTTPMEAGTVLLCRDRSQIFPAVCPFSTAGAPTSAFSGPWRPCFEVTTCNVSPASVSSKIVASPSGGPGNLQYSLTYNNLPIGCQANIEMMALDTAGNMTFGPYNAVTHAFGPCCSLAWVAGAWSGCSVACGSPGVQIRTLTCKDTISGAVYPASSCSGIPQPATTQPCNNGPCCTCNAWVKGACGVGGCGKLQRLQTRSCSPNSCQAQVQCVNDPTCPPPSPPVCTSKLILQLPSGCSAGLPFPGCGPCIVTNQWAACALGCAPGPGNPPIGMTQIYQCTCK